MLSRDANWFGGVINLVLSLKNNYSPDVVVTDFLIGGRKTASFKLFRYFQPLIDALHLFRLLGKECFDVVHINPSLNTKSLLRDGLFMLVLRLKKQNTLVFFHGWDEKLSARIQKSAVRCWLMRQAFGHSPRILVLASGFRDQLVEMGLDVNNISTITTMFDGKQLRSVRKPRRMHGQNILFLSRFVHEKGLFELIDAFSRISKKFPDARMVMAGEGPSRDELEQAIKQSGLADVVELPGYIRGEDKAVLLTNADIFVLPTYYGEGCPVSMLEAMAAGLAIVSTPVGGIPDILHDGVNGALLESANPELIYDALHDLLSSEEKLAVISQTNIEQAWKRYEAAVITAEIEGYYQQVSGI